jgi:hypothetical protein
LTTLEPRSFADLLTALPDAGGGEPKGAYRVQPVAGTRHYVGRNAEDMPTVLLGSPAGRVQAPVRLAAIEVLFSTTCKISLSDGRVEEEVLTVITCVSHDAKVQAYFLHVCETIARIVGPSPAHGDVVEAVRRVIELFERVTRPPTRSALGLIAELYLIAQSREPRLAARAWRSDDNNRFDFAIEDVRIEVKASGTRLRSHHFSLEQCEPPPGTIGILASVFVETVGGGKSMQELIEDIGLRIADDALLLKVQAGVAETLGSGLPEALSLRFDEALAASSLRFFDLRTIPAVRGVVPAEVTEVRFRANLSAQLGLPIDEVSRRSALAARLLSRR